MAKIRKNSNLYKLNIERLNFLINNGVNVKLDGSWGPWLLKLYDRIKSKSNFKSKVTDFFTNAMIGAAVADEPAIAAASGWYQDKNSNWKLKRTPESNLLADNLETLSWWSPAHPGSAALGIAGLKTLKYGKDVYSRYKFANIPINKDIKLVELVAKKYLPELQMSSKGNRYFGESGVGVIGDGQEFHTYGGMLMKPGTTSEIHFNPEMSFLYKEGIVYPTLVKPRPSTKRTMFNVLSDLPSGTVIASSSDARSVSQVIQSSPLLTRTNYYLTGRTPKLEQSVVDGYSTDVIELLNGLHGKGRGMVVPSLTTKMSGTNILGSSFNKYASYFPKTDKEFVYFSDMSPEQLNAWNTEIAPSTGMYVDPKTRLSPHLMFIKK